MTIATIYRGGLTAIVMVRMAHRILRHFGMTGGTYHEHAKIHR
jgi:hypothetical protein